MLAGQEGWVQPARPFAQSASRRMRAVLTTTALTVTARCSNRGATPRPCVSRATPRSPTCRRRYPSVATRRGGLAVRLVGPDRLPAARLLRLGQGRPARVSGALHFLRRGRHRARHPRDPAQGRARPQAATRHPCRLTLCCNPGDAGHGAGWCVANPCGSIAAMMTTQAHLRAFRDDVYCAALTSGRALAYAPGTATER